MDRKLKVTNGSFIEGEYVTVSINGAMHRRKVRYNKCYGLYIVIGDRVYFEYDFDYE